MNGTEATALERDIDSLTAEEKTALNEIIDNIFNSSRNIATQIPEDKIAILLKEVDKAVQKQKETYWPKPQSFKELKRNLRYFLKNGFQKPEVTNVNTLDLAEIMENREKNKENLLSKNPAIAADPFEALSQVVPLSTDILTTILRKFQIIPSVGEDLDLWSIEKAITEEKQARGIDKQTLIITGLEKLHYQSQALVLEMLVKHLAKKATFSVNILHNEPITRYYSHGEESIGLHPNDNYLDSAPEWPKKAEEI